MIRYGSSLTLRLMQDKKIVPFINRDLRKLPLWKKIKKNYRLKFSRKFL